MEVKKVSTFILAVIMCLALIPSYVMAADDVTFTAVDGTTGNNNENYTNLFDGKKVENNYTKYCVKFGTSGVYVIAKASESVFVTGYTFTSGNDNASYKNRNPKSWVLYGSNDYDNNAKTGTWEKIDSVSNDAKMQDVNFTSFYFNFDNEAAYQYYKFDFKENQGSDVMQLCEIEFDYTTEKHIWKETSRTEPTCTQVGQSYQTCTECGLERTLEIPVIDHEWVDDSGKEPTCFEMGYSVKHCEVCGLKKEEEILPLGHTEGDNGYCARCGEHIIRIGDTYYFNLQDAVNAATNDQTIEILQNIAIDGEIGISKNITVDLNGFTIKQIGSSRLFSVYKTLTLKDSSENRTGTLCGGTADNGGGVYVDEKAALNMVGGTISGCTAKYEGGGIFVKNKATLNMSDGAVIKDCTALNIHGGGIMNYGTAEIKDSKIINSNAKSGGGGIYTDGLKSIGALDLYNSVIEECSSEINGGGGIGASSAAVTLNENTIIRKNTASSYYGAGICATKSTTVEINGSRIEENIANEGAGILANGNSSIILSKSEITNNNASISGGGIMLSSASLTIENANINNNATSGNGGGIYAVYESNINFKLGEINYNTAEWGGGVYLHKGSNITISDGSYITNNTAKYNGGGVIINDSYNVKKSTLTMTGGSISHNEAVGDESDGNGGGICGQKKAVIDISGGTIDCNKAVNGGGIALLDNSALTLSGAADISQNTAKSNGGGVYINNQSNMTLSDRSKILQNDASGMGGGIYADGTLSVSGAPHVSENGIAFSDAESGEINIVKNNIYLPAGKTITIVGEGLSTIKGDTGYISPTLYVTAENGIASITGTCSKSNLKYLHSDNENYVAVYKDGVVELLNGDYEVSFIYNAEHNDIRTVAAAAGYPVREPDGEAWDDAGRTFIGWQLNGEDYDLETLVTGNITLTPKFAEKGKTAVSVDFNKFYVVELNQNAKAYIAAYDKDGNLIDAYVDTINEEYFPISYSKSFEDIGLQIEGANKIMVFLWDENMVPLCDKAYKILN